VGKARVALWRDVEAPPDEALAQAVGHTRRHLAERARMKRLGRPARHQHRRRLARGDHEETRPRLRREQRRVDLERADAIAEPVERADERGEIGAAVRAQQSRHVLQRQHVRRAVLVAKFFDERVKAPERARARRRKPAARAREREVLAGKGGPGQGRLAGQVGARQLPDVALAHMRVAESGAVGARLGGVDVVGEDAGKIRLEPQPRQPAAREKLIEWGAGITLHASILAPQGGPRPCASCPAASRTKRGRPMSVRSLGPAFAMAMAAVLMVSGCQRQGEQSQEPAGSPTNAEREAQLAAEQLAALGGPADAAQRALYEGEFQASGGIAALDADGAGAGAEGAWDLRLLTDYAQFSRPGLGEDGGLAGERVYRAGGMEVVAGPLTITIMRQAREASGVQLEYVANVLFEGVAYQGCARRGIDEVARPTWASLLHELIPAIDACLSRVS